jgi:tetratricopeptide (TPR) repeat protein
LKPFGYERPWSWDLLSLPEKAALAQLSVFEGGFTLESVEAVLDLSAYDNAPWPMDALQSLVQKSLVRQVADTRFDLLVSVQEYAGEHLRTAARYPESGPAALLAAEARHGAYFANLDAKAAIAHGCAELDNLVVACRRAAARGDADMAARALEGAWTGLNLRGPFRVGIELASEVRAIPGLDGAAVVRASRVAGSALYACGKNAEARAQFETSLARAREAGDRYGECRALVSLGFADTDEGRLESARAQATAALVIARETGDSTLQSHAHNVLGGLDELMGRPKEALAHYETALAFIRKAGDPQREGAILGNLSNVYFQLGLMDQARSNSEAVLAVARAAGNRRLEGNTLCNLGLLDQVQGRFADALDRLEAALAITRDIGHVNAECIVLCNLGMVHHSLSHRDEAQGSFEASLTLARELGHRRTEGQILGYLGLLHAHGARFDEARACLDSGEALLRSLSDQTSLGILLCNRAETEHLAGVTSVAEAALAAAEAIATDVRSGADSELGLALARVRSLLADEQRLRVDVSVAG